MEISLQQIAFFVVAIFMSVFSILTVISTKILRSATYLLFVLFGTAILYFMLGYTFLGAVQLMVYAGGIVVLYVFSVQLTESDSILLRQLSKNRAVAVFITIPIGLALVMFLILTNGFVLDTIPLGVETELKEIGHALIGSGKYQYILPFEVMSILLLACMVGALLIARKR